MTIGRTNYLRDHNKPAAILCFDHIFRDFNKQTDITGSDVQILDKTRALCYYAEFIWEILCLPEPWAKGGVQRLFSFTVHSGRVCLPRGTFLHGFVRPFQRSQLLDEDTMIEVRSFVDLYQRTLRQRLREKLEAYCNNSLSVRVYDPCEAVAFVAFGRCDYKDCQRQHELNHAWFDKRLHFHMCQISILNFLRFISPDSHRFDMDLHRFDLLLSIFCPH